MIVDELKISILEKAIRGLLVKNNEDVNLIENELESYYEKYSGKKDLSTAQDFEIPNSWRWVKLGNISFSNIGLTYKPTDLVSNNGTPVLRSNNIKDGKFIKDDLVYVGIDVPKNKMCYPNDILMCSRNGSKRLVGKCTIINEDGYSFGAFMAIIRSDINKYLYYVFNSNYFRKKMLGDASTTTINQITQKMLANFYVPLPPLEEQDRIVKKIEELFKKLNEIKPIEEELNDLKKSFPVVLKKSLFLSAIKGELSLNKQTEKIDESVANISTLKDIPFDIPNNWKWFGHNDLFEIVGGSQPPKSKFSSVCKDGYVQLYQTRDYGPTPQPIYVNKDDVSKFSKKGDIILARYGGSLGKVFWAEDGAYNVALAKVIIKYPEIIDSKYLYYYYLANIYQTKVKSGNRSAQAGFSKEDLRDLAFPLPPIEEQHRIVNKIEQILPICNIIDNIVSE